MIAKYTEDGLPILPEKPTRNDYREPSANTRSVLTFACMNTGKAAKSPV